MLSLSFIWAVFLLGLPILWHFYQAHRIASQTVVPNAPADTWIIFGKKLQQNKLDQDYQQRIAAVYQTLPVHTPKTLIFQGGMTHKNTITEAQAGLDYLSSQFDSVSLAQQNIHTILEDTSKNTLENLRNTRNLLKAQQQPLKVVVISNRYHLLRCATIAKNMGFTTQLLPAEPQWQFTLAQGYKLLLEALFLNWYITGSTLSRIMNNQRMLNKIQ